MFSLGYLITKYKKNCKDLGWCLAKAIFKLLSAKLVQSFERDFNRKISCKSYPLNQIFSNLITYHTNSSIHFRMLFLWVSRCSHHFLILSIYRTLFWDSFICAFQLISSILTPKMLFDSWLMYSGVASLSLHSESTDLSNI
jgi:ectoine hydroxylase-related dioxygenase (phytanoyl-CoA dioxygenase family)